MCEPSGVRRPRRNPIRNAHLAAIALQRDVFPRHPTPVAVSHCIPNFPHRRPPKNPRYRFAVADFSFSTKEPRPHTWCAFFFQRLFPASPALGGRTGFPPRKLGSRRYRVTPLSAATRFGEAEHHKQITFSRIAHFLPGL